MESAFCRPVPPNSRTPSVHAEDALMQKLRKTQPRLKVAGPRFKIVVENLKGGQSTPCSRCVRILPPKVPVVFRDKDGKLRSELPGRIDATPSGGTRRMQTRRKAL